VRHSSRGTGCPPVMTVNRGGNMDQQTRTTTSRLGGHPRFAGNFASLDVAAGTALEFAAHLGIITADEAAAIRERGRRAMLQLGRQGARDQERERPAVQFLFALRDLLARGENVLYELVPTGRSLRVIEHAQDAAGPLGWQTDDCFFLIGNACIAAITSQFGALSVSPSMIWKELRELHILVPSQRGRLTSSVTIDDQQQWTYALNRRRVEQVWKRQ